MLTVHFKSEEPAAHLACDEVLLDGFDRLGETLRFYEIDGPAVILGVSSRWERDVNADECRQAHVPILRRASGGGAVLLAQGCLGYSVIFDLARRTELRMVRASYRWILGRIAGAMAERGVPSQVSGLSDLSWHGRKVGGNAQKRTSRALLHHGTLLYGLDARLPERFLSLPEAAPDYRAGRSHQEFMANIPLPVDELELAVAQALGVPADGAAVDITDDVADAVATLVWRKYGSDEWNLRR